MLSRSRADLNLIAKFNERARGGVYRAARLLAS